MKHLTILLIVSALLAPAGAVAAQTAMDPLESYCATLGEEDHFASDGYRLKDAAAIIRQDRANFHVLGQRDPSDEDDSTFASKANRARLEGMLKRGSIDRADARRIIDGTPDVCIDIYEDYIAVVVN
jgi:hypothetical protein